MRDTQFGLGLLDGFFVGFDRGFACALTNISDGYAFPLVTRSGSTGAIQNILEVGEN